MATIGALIGVVFVLIILGVIWWGINQLLPLIPLPPPFRTIIHVIIVLILVIIVLWVIAILLGVAGIHVGWPFNAVR